MSNSLSDKSRLTHTTDERRQIDARELADHLEFAREVLGGDSSLPEETRRELERSLGHAEAALRRAVAERTVFVRMRNLLGNN